jgi:hypothetical protein
MKLAYTALITAAIIPLCGCYDQSSYDAALEADTKQREVAYAQAAQDEAQERTRRDKAWADSDSMLEKERAMQKRWEALLTKQEHQAARFDTILTKWESLPDAKDQ